MPRIRCASLTSIFLLLILRSLAAQEVPVDAAPGPDAFDRMRKLAEEGRYDSATMLGHRILEEDPDHFDAALYMARIYGWQAQYDSAYAILGRLLSREPDLFEAHEILVDLAYWENDWVKLEEVAARALELQPDSPQIREKYLLARRLQAAGQEAAELFLHYYYDHFSQPYARNWHMITAGSNIPVKFGVLSPYVNGGYHAGAGNPSTDLQVNLDAYLNLGKKNHAMAGYGISPDGLIDYLPRHRAALELWQVLPKGFGVSVGLRYFYWDQSFTFLTVSGEKYTGNYYLSLRSYLFFKDYGVSGSYYLTARRYFADKFNYLSLTLGYGTAPDEPLLVVSDLDRLNAVSARMEFSKQLRPRLRMNLMGGYAYEEFDNAAYRNRFDVRVGFYFRLKK